MAKTFDVISEDDLKRLKKGANGVTFLDGEIYRIHATNDYMFKNLFGVNGKEENLKHLLHAILKINIESLQIQNPEFPRDTKKDKKGILDVRAKLKDGTLVFIEMQVRDEHNFGERFTYYICKLYSGSVETGEQYNKIEKSIAIILTNFSYFNRKEYHQIAHLKFEECTNPDEIVDEKIDGNISDNVTDKLELHIIDLKKFRKLKQPKGELAEWLKLIIGDEEGIFMASKKNKILKKVNEENKRLSLDKQMQEQYWYEQKALYAHNTMISVATDKGKEIGKKIGEEIGKTKEKREIAKKLKEKNMTLDEIADLTGLPKEDIEKL